MIWHHSRMRNNKMNNFNIANINTRATQLNPNHLENSTPPSTKCFAPSSNQFAPHLLKFQFSLPSTPEKSSKFYNEKQGATRISFNRVITSQTNRNSMKNENNRICQKLRENFQEHHKEKAMLKRLSKTTFCGKTNFSSSFKKKSMIIPNVEEKLLSKFKTQRSSVITENKDIIKRNKLLEKEIRFNKNDRFHWYQKQIEEVQLSKSKLAELQKRKLERRAMDLIEQYNIDR